MLSVASAFSRKIRTGPRLFALFGAVLCVLASPSAQRPAADFEALPFAPRRYVAYRAPSALTLDGKLDEPAWTAAAWSELFVDIEGDSRPRPRFRTRMKMLWDDEFFYVAADMEEPDLWGTLTARDSVIFHDNDFEVFVDPDGDTHAYYELEVNALGTAWDLMLLKPYRDGGRAIDAWDIAGLKVRHRSARHDQSSGRSRRRLERGNRDALADAARGRGQQQAAAAGRSLARQLLARRVADRCHRRPLRETAEAGLEGSAAREQLGLEPARRHQHAHARTLGFRSVFWR